MDLLGLLKMLDNLKHLKRRGWVDFHVGSFKTVQRHFSRFR